MLFGVGVERKGEGGNSIPEQPGDEGRLPFVFEVAGSRVAVMAVTKVRMVRRVERVSILNGWMDGWVNG